MISIQELLLEELEDVLNERKKLNLREHEILLIWYSDYSNRE